VSGQTCPARGRAWRNAAALGVASGGFAALGVSAFSIAMRFHVVATDYDGTLATDGKVSEQTRAALDRLRTSARKLLLVTGRQIDDLLTVCPDLSPFELVVAENGALLYWPATKEQRVLAEAPPPAFVEALRAQGVPDVAVGKVIVATWQPHESKVLQVIQEQGLELQVIFNKAAVMVLPSGVNKASGLDQALALLGYSAHECVGIGDAENDHAFLGRCEAAIAVENAIPALKERSDLVTSGARGAGVVELIEQLMANDLAELDLGRHDLEIGTDAEQQPVLLPAYGSTPLLAGTSGGGKSTLVTAFVEQLTQRRYQFCILDPEGDYTALPGAAVVGDRESPSTVAEVLKLLESPSANVVVNLVAIGIENRPAFFEELMPRLLEHKLRTGRPHFIVVDEAHHLAPRDTASRAFSQGDWSNVLFVTVHPKHVSDALLRHVDVMLAIGAAPAETIGEFTSNRGVRAPQLDAAPLEAGEAFLWRCGQSAAQRVRTIVPMTERKRHIRKYAAGDLEDRSFYFRGPKKQLNLRAQNLSVFLQLADGVDDATWLHHLRAGDYERWMRNCIKDPALADEVAAVQHEVGSGSARRTRAAVRGAVERRYTAPE
jgi:HAD superfamily hydrolase (TIGR01484 family)